MLLRRMLDVFPESRITACQSLRSPYFSGDKDKEPLMERGMSNYAVNLPPLKTSANNGTAPKKTKRIDNPEN